MTFETTIVFDWERPPLTANQRLHWATKARLTKTVRLAAALASSAVPPMPKIAVRLVWVVNTRHRRDTDNTYPTFKALCDGLVDARIVPDDTPEFMDKLAPAIRYEKDATPHVELVVQEAS